MKQTIHILFALAPAVLVGFCPSLFAAASSLPPVLCRMSTHSPYTDKTIEKVLVFEDGGGLKASVQVNHAELNSKLDYILFLSRSGNDFRYDVGGKWPGASGYMHWVNGVMRLGGASPYIGLGEQIVLGDEKPVEIVIDCSEKRTR